MNCGIYKITNMVNSKVYIGSSVHLQRRAIQHKSNLKCNRHHNLHLQNSYNKYGFTNFIFEILLYCSEKYLLFFEQRAITEYKTFNGDFGYNICPAARIDLLGSNSVERSRKISEANSGKNNGQAKEITINGKHYDTIKGALADLNLSGATLWSRIASTIDLNKDIIVSVDKYVGDPISINGKDYDTKADAARALGINYNTLLSRIEKCQVLDSPVLIDTKGKNNPAAKSITINGKHYDTVKEAADDLSINYLTLIYRIKENVDLNKVVANKGKFHCAAKPVIINGKRYDTMKEAEQKVNISRKTIKKRINENKPGYSWANKETK